MPDPNSVEGGSGGVPPKKPAPFLFFMVKKLTTTVRIGETIVPTTIHLESRHGFRASLGKNGLILRLPTRTSQTELQEKLVWATDWLQKVFEKKPKLQLAHQPKNWKTGDEITVGKRKYFLEIDFEDRETHVAKLQNAKIILQLSRHDNPAHLQKSIKTLLSRTIAQDFLPEITARVHELNQRFFKKNIKSVSLKYNASNWGSCSTKENINLSTRLLFAPPEVVDYVIVHELAHLIEMNHSDRFWAIVGKVMPDFEAKERWLKKHGPLCDF